MTKGLKELKRMAYENACCRCQYYINNKCTNKGECVWKTIEKELKEPINLINKELRNARKLLTYDNYRCGYIDALITIKNEIKEQDNEK